jgi:hypothetical protein
MSHSPRVPLAGWNPITAGFQFLHPGRLSLDELIALAISLLLDETGGKVSELIWRTVADIAVVVNNEVLPRVSRRRLLRLADLRIQFSPRETRT